MTSKGKFNLRIIFFNIAIFLFFIFDHPQRKFVIFTLTSRKKCNVLNDFCGHVMVFFSSFSILKDTAFCDTKNPFNTSYLKKEARKEQNKGNENSIIKNIRHVKFWRKNCEKNVTVFSSSLQFFWLNFEMMAEQNEHCYFSLCNIESFVRTLCVNENSIHFVIQNKQYIGKW